MYTEFSKKLWLIIMTIDIGQDVLGLKIMIMWTFYTKQSADRLLLYGKTSLFEYLVSGPFKKSC